MIYRICSIYIISSMGSKHGKPVLREEDITQLASTSGLDRKQVRKIKQLKHHIRKKDISIYDCVLDCISDYDFT